MKVSVGDRSGLLTVVRLVNYARGSRAICKCDCGNEWAISCSKFATLRFKSCGCNKHACKVDDITGMTFGALTVIKREGSIAVGTGVASAWLCKCDCGKTVTKPGFALRKSRGFISCGCRKINPQLTHGMCRSAIYRRWHSMMKRCYSSSNPSFCNYGGRGISVCQRWHDFANFYADMGEPPFQGATLERINNDGNYEPENCRWATRADQSANKRNTVLITHNGVTKCLTNWARTIGLDRKTLEGRLKSGWSVERALTTPRLR